MDARIDEDIYFFHGICFLAFLYEGNEFFLETAVIIDDDDDFLGQG